MKGGSDVAIVTWGPKMEIGVPEIDLQHRNLVAIANHLHDAISANQAQQAVDWILEELTLYVKFHFDSEERLMQELDYVDTEKHQLEHKEMLKAIRRFKKHFHAGEPRVEREVMDFLGGWLLQHIMGTDRALGRHYAAKNDKHK